jgi:hypothetical protein
MTKRVQRLAPSQATRDKISMSLTGVPKSKAHVAAVADALRGRPRSEETKRRIAETMARTRGMTKVEKWHYYRSRTREHKKDARRATEQKRVDMFTALLIKNVELYHDVKRSQGFRRNRKVFDPTGRVSDGYGQGRVWWPMVEVKDGVP